MITVESDFLQFKDGNLFPEGIDAQRALDILTEFFLGEDYYIAAPVNPQQANAIITDNIMNRFPRKYKKFCKKKGWL